MLLSMRWKNRWTHTSLTFCTAKLLSSPELKSGALGARTIDEGSMDEKNGMNFSEYMAILSGNTDLLEKAKLEKRIAALESERKSFNKGRGDSEFKLQTITHDIANNEAAIERMRADWERYDKVVQRDKDGNPINNLTIDTCNLSDEKNLGIHLQGLAQRTDTHGLYQRIGEVYGFPISIISERVVSDGVEKVQNRFVVEGNYKYKYNNGQLAMADTHAACMNFVNALEKNPRHNRSIRGTYRQTQSRCSNPRRYHGKRHGERGRVEATQIRTCLPRPQNRRRISPQA